MHEHFRKVAEPVVEPYTSATLCLLTAEQPDPVVAAGQYFDARAGKIEPIIGLVGVGVGIGPEMSRFLEVGASLITFGKERLVGEIDEI